MLVNIYTGASLSGGRCKQARVKPNSPTKSKRLHSEPLRSLNKQVRPQTSRQLTSVEISNKEVNSGKFIVYYLFFYFRETRNNWVSAVRYFNRNQRTRKSMLYKRPEMILRTVMRYLVKERMTSHQVWILMLRLKVLSCKHIPRQVPVMGHKVTSRVTPHSQSMTKTWQMLPST